MSWYSGRLLFGFVVGTGKKRSDRLFEEKLVIFKARNRSESISKLTKIAKSNEDTYKNANGDWVHYNFREILEIQEILEKQIGDGVEVFFRFWENPTADDFRFMRETHEDPWWKRKRGAGSRQDR